MRHTVLALAALAVLALSSIGCDDEDNPDEITVRSAAFGPGNTIPERHTCDGNEISPPLTFTNLPEETVTLALVVEDPDGANGIVSHWVLWGIPRDKGFLGEDQPKVVDLGQGMTQGTNAADTIGYFGPCPPGGETHRYDFRVYALDTAIQLVAGATRSQLLGAIEGHVIGEGVLTGVYWREEEEQ